ncbi:AAA family ATPase [Shewanella sp. 3_MG-2023]|uniref:AAA family ATPase n=1 Tax=Shewanella sp. 3_MG-2023 TaxID=3062635 RepID=UPI0026E2DC93|nr:AAA family ATPase [Shewanella sp. 3_MG-2023]MDO6776229.1 AAA family ATPase [Shewanella sp. 3_MG-2023]
MKFKRVEIQAFKSYLYKQDGTFDFTVKTDEPADLVSIYAPNGFGKTSFYDAIDFCMTNNITRFIRDPSLANVNNSDAKELNQSGQKQHILRTKNAPDEIESSVQITTTDKDPIKRSVPLARKGSKDYTFDDKKTNPEERYFRSVMLSQEAIDGFLRELKPETRYEQFMAQQLAGDDTLEKNRKQIQFVLKELNSRLYNIQNKVDEIKKKNLSLELGEGTTIDVSCLTNINELAAELNEQGGDFSVFDNSFDDELNAKLKLKVEQLQEKANQKIEGIQIEKSQLEKLVDSFHIFDKKHNEIKDSKSEISKLSKQKSDIEQWQLLNEKKYLLTEQFGTQREFFEKLQVFNKRLPDFIKQAQLKHEYTGKLTELRRKVTGKEQKIKVSDSKQRELEIQERILQKKIEQLEIQRNEAVKHFSEISRIEDNINRHNNVELISKNIDDLESDIAHLKSEGVAVKHFKVEELDLMIASKFKNDVLIKIAKDYSATIIKQESLNTQLRDLNQSLDAVNLQKDSIANLIKIGSQLINQSQEKHCPLCQHEHESFTVLADAINSNSSLSDSQQRLLKEVENCQSLLKEEVNKLKKLKEDFLVAQEARLIFLRENLQESLEKQKSTDQILEQIEKEKVEVERLKELTYHKAPELFQAYINDEIAKIKVNGTSLATQIAETKVEYRQLNEDAQKLKLDLSVLVSESENTDALLTNDLLLLTELEVSHEIIELKLNEQKLNEIIAYHFKKAEDLFNGKEQEVKENNDAINTLTAQYTASFFEHPISKIEALILKISELNDELVRLNESIREFYTAVQQLGEERLLVDSNWIDLKRKFDGRISYLDQLKQKDTDLISRFTSLTTLAEQVLKYINVVKSTKEQQKLELEIGKCEGIKKAFLTDLRGINEALEAQVNQYFHADLINTIYRKIDPHPDFKRIDFNCSFPEDGKPKLQVYITDEDGNNAVSPMLSFSSAQINVLSLSIFLAKALNTTNAGKPVDCIFIDDPVQSMDSINVLGVIDLLRSISTNLGKQIIISTHDDNFHALLKQKLPEHLFKSKFLELETFGKVATHAGQ